MREVTLILDDDALYKAIEAEAKSTGHTVQEIVVQALQQWRAESDIDERAELAEARREWEETGGMEAHAFFDSLREEESGIDR